MAEVIAAVTPLLTDYAPIIFAGAVFGLAGYFLRRLIKGAR